MTPSNGESHYVLMNQDTPIRFVFSSDIQLNAHYRKHKTMKGFPGITDKTAAEMDEAISHTPAFAQPPFPDFKLASLRAKIKRTRENLAKLNKMDAAQGKLNQEEHFDGGYMVHNISENRLQLHFDEIPGEETRAALKRSGFR